MKRNIHDPLFNIFKCCTKMCVFMKVVCNYQYAIKKKLQTIKHGLIGVQPICAPLFTRNNILNLLVQKETSCFGIIDFSQYEIKGINLLRCIRRGSHPYTHEIHNLSTGVSLGYVLDAHIIYINDIFSLKDSTLVYNFLQDNYDTHVIPTPIYVHVSVEFSRHAAFCCCIDGYLMCLRV